MGNIEEKFKKLMKKEGLEKLIKPKVYIATFVFPPSENKEPTEAERFKTPEEREEWYKKIGIEFENAYPGCQVEFSEEFEESEK